MTMFETIASSLHALISKFLDEDDEELDMSGAVEGNLTDFLAHKLEAELNGSKQGDAA